jgi:hypothetical protein
MLTYTSDEAKALADVMMPDRSTKGFEGYLPDIRVDRGAVFISYL